MWSQILLCVLVAFASASDNPGWNENSEYVYQVRGRSLASLNQISTNYSGIVLRAKLTVQPNSEGNLDGKISEAQYAQIHAQLEDGWDAEIPDSELSYKQLPISSRPFQVVMYEGAVRNLIVDKQTTNWEGNIIKSIISQLQLDTKATNLIPSHINILAQDASNAVYKTMEETVTGVSETLYEIHPLPEYVLQTTPWLVPRKDLVGDDEIIEVVKSKNFTHSAERPSYHFGVHGIDDYEPANKMADFSSRTSLSRAVITGNLNQFTIQSSVTFDQIILGPTMSDKQMGSVNTMVNVSLLAVQKSSGSWQPPSDSVRTGVVYTYNQPFDSSNEPVPAEEYDHDKARASAESKDSEENSRRFKRSIADLRNSLSRSGGYDYAASLSEEEFGYQKQPQLQEPPPSPLLPFTVGYDGQSIAQKENVVEKARKLAEKIGQEVQQPEGIPEENTIGKYLILSRLVKVMDPNQMQQAASQLYSNEQHGPQVAAWKIFRDAIAQAGTGPALITIKDWIKTNKIVNESAAEVVSIAANSARQPTEQYMKAFFEMLQDETVMSQSHLNESVLLSYTKLVYEVCANKRYAHSKYPVHSYGPFCTTSVQDYITTTVIPYLSRKLNEAISQDDTQNIHAYIRALGNVGQKEILQAFEQYLEGQKQASHFQRVLMVVALDNLAKSDPRVARSVLYKIYQNPSEHEQVRAAAVYQLMHTYPPPSMLQGMASYTNIDPNHYVNSAVKSAIESASHLEGHKYVKLASAARSAKHLLTSEEYGDQYSHQNLRSYVAEQMKQVYKQDEQYFVAPDYAFPNGIKYSLERRIGGVREQLIDKYAIVSSVEDLINVCHKHTKKYQQQQQEKQDHDPTENPWSSESIAKVLGMDNEQRERLEGNFYLHMGALQKIWSFDNHTINNFPEVVQEMEEQLRQGKHYDYSKMIVGHETAIAFPTGLGLPFIYTYDRPTFVQVETTIKANANPPISDGTYISKPESIDGQLEIRAVVSGRSHSQFGIFTPFDKQRYSAGYDKNFQVIVPLSAKIHVNVKENQLSYELQNANGEQNIRLLHYSALPYTSQHDIYDLTPQKQIIRKKHPHVFNQVLGQESTGIALDVKMKSDHIISYASLYDKFRKHDLVSAVLSPWVDENIQYVYLNAVVDMQQSTTNKIAVQLSYNEKYVPSDGGDNYRSGSRKRKFSEDPLQRRNEMEETCSEGIDSAYIRIGEANVAFDGQKQIKYTTSAALCKSNVDPKGRFLALFKRVNKQNQPLSFYFDAKTYVPNTNGLNLNYAMEMNTTSTANIEASFTEHNKQPSKIYAQVELSKSERRKQYLKEQPQYAECQRQMSEGNYQLPICAQMTARANLLDKFSVQVKAENIDARIVNHTYKVYSALRHQFYPRFEENIVDVRSENLPLPNPFNVDFEGQFHPHLQAVNFSIQSPYGRVEARNLKMNHWAQSFLVLHPVFHARSRLAAYLYKYDTYRPICVVDENAASTFDNKTYPADLDNKWTVLLQYVPRRPSQNYPPKPVPEQLRKHLESHVVLVRSYPQDHAQKELKLVVQTPDTKGQIVEISLQPKGSYDLPRLFVDGKEIRYSSEAASDFYEGYIQAYALPNNELKLELFGAYYIIYDGTRVKLTAVSSKFRDAARGLCGTFTGEPETDFSSPDYCILREPQDFVKSYTVPQNPDRRMRKRSQPEECFQKKVVPVNYISAKDSGNARNVGDREQSSRSGSSCTRLQTQYVMQGDQTCFTLHPLPVCKRGCRQAGSVSKNVPVHCLRTTSATQLWKNEIDKGASPDFRHKSQSRTIRMSTPQRCLP